MSRLRERVEAEVENIDQALKNLPDAEALGQLSVLGTGRGSRPVALVHRCRKHHQTGAGPSRCFDSRWGSVASGFDLKRRRDGSCFAHNAPTGWREYLAFRHFFTTLTHSMLTLHALNRLVRNLFGCLSTPHEDLKAILS